MMNPIHAGALLLGMVVAGAWAAQPEDATLGIDLGTTGIGLQARLPLSTAYAIYGRLSANTLPP